MFAVIAASRKHKPRNEGLIVNVDGTIFLALVLVVSYQTYRTLPEDTQIDLLFEFGVYLQLVRNTVQLSIELYSLGDFYVEIYFDRVTEDPLFLRPFNAVKELEPYFPFIEIEDVFQTNQ